MEVLEPMLARMFVQEAAAGDVLDLPGFISTKLGLHEDVSDINGVAIPAIYQEHLRTADRTAAIETNGKTGDIAETGLLGVINEKIKKLYSSQHPFLRREFSSLPRPLATPEDYLRAANLYLAIQDQLYFRVKQISRDEYAWLTPSTVQQCLARFDASVGSELGAGAPLAEFEDAFIDVGQEFEHSQIDAVLARAWPGAPTKFRFSARADLITGTALWELKCTSTLSEEHFLQTIIYAWLWRLVPHAAEADSAKEARLFNVMTGEKWRVEASDEDLTGVVVCLLRDKYASLAVAEDDAFVEAGQAYL
jgi:hypothetical protein